MKGFVEDDISRCCFFIFDFIDKDCVLRILGCWDKCIQGFPNGFNNHNVKVCDFSVVNNFRIKTFDFWYMVSVITCTSVSDWLEVDVSIFVVSCCIKNVSFVITKFEGEFTTFKCATLELFCEVETCWRWLKVFNRICEGFVLWIGYGWYHAV